MSEIADVQTKLAPADNVEDSKTTKGAWWMLIVLTSTYVISFIDRGALALVVGPIKEDLGISDLQVSLLLGLSFMLLYSMLSIPMGILVDKYQRKTLLGGAIMAWSVVQMLCGLSTTYLQLFFTRVGLGVGESALAPGSQSMIRDAFPPHRRSIAFGIYNIGPMLGTGLSMALGGVLLKAASAGAFDTLPVVGGMKPWHFVLLVPGIIGVPFAILLWLLREPPRRFQTDISDVTYKQTMCFVWKNRGVYVQLWAAICLYGIAIGSQMAWLPEIIARTLHVARPEIGKAIGGVALLASPLGLLICGGIADRLRKRGMVDAPVRVAALTTAIAAVVTACFPLVHTMSAGIVLYFVQMFMFAMFAVAGGATNAEFTPGNMMGKITALYYLITNLVGLALGPTVVALVAKFFDGPNALGASFVICYVVSVALAVILLIRVSGALRRPVVQ
ncbi:MFS family permease [Paraburkholderia sp. MM5496-R1]|uniref:MFS transporter n=1 Tax=Paraburkholderia sp. MM5496-R1 TaxID=2991065 RepID=UPI003D20360C